jgi:cytochrome b561
MSESVRVWPLSLRLIHWSSAALVIGALCLGVYMVQFVQNPAERFDFTQTHKSIGVTIFALTVVRLCLRIRTATPKREPCGPVLLLVAKATHIGLYALLLLVPTTVLGLLELPYPFAPHLPTYQVAHAIHVAAAFSLATLIILHVTAAIAHALWWRDRTVARMWRKDEKHLHNFYTGQS